MHGVQTNLVEDSEHHCRVDAKLQLTPKLRNNAVGNSHRDPSQRSYRLLGRRLRGWAQLAGGCSNRHRLPITPNHLPHSERYIGERAVAMPPEDTPRTVDYLGIASTGQHPHSRRTRSFTAKRVTAARHPSGEHLEIDRHSRLDQRNVRHRRSRRPFSSGATQCSVKGDRGTVPFAPWRADRF